MGVLAPGGNRMLGWLFTRNKAPRDFGAPRFAYARQMGEDAALGLSGEWRDVERMLHGIWRQESAGMTWKEARPIIRHAWRLAKDAGKLQNA